MSKITWKPRSEPPDHDGIFLCHDGYTYYAAEYVAKDDNFYATVADDGGTTGPAKFWALIDPPAPSDATD